MQPELADAELDDLFNSTEFQQSLAKIELELNVNNCSDIKGWQEEHQAAAEMTPRPNLPSSPFSASNRLRRKFRKGFLSVSDFARLQWCEQQVFYAAVGRPMVVTSGVKRKEVAKKEGTALHKKIEEVVLGPAVVIETTTKEDFWAIT